MKASGKPLLTTISSAFIDYNSSVVTSFINSYSNSTTTTYSSNNDGNSHSNSNRNKNSNSNNDNITSALTASIESTKVTTNPNSSKEEEKVIRTRTNLLYSITIELTNTFQLCNPNFQLSPTTTQKRILTIPSEGKYNNNLDNVDSNLICKVHDKLTNNLTNTNYVILDLLGTGTFGQVFRCQKEDTKEVVAIKIIKNKPAYYNQGMLEMKILRLLNKTYDPLNQKHIVRLLESFECNNHICLVFEQLSMSLLDVLTQNQYRGLPLSIVQRFTRQIITALVAMEDANVIHCDLKPENILLVPISKDKIERKTLKSTDKTVVSNSLGTTTDQSNVSNNNSSNNLNEMDDSNGNYSNSSNQTNDSTTQQTNTSSPNSINENKKTKKSGILSDIKVIDFGSACFEGRTIYSYIQSRFYRAPEVLLGNHYNGAIDMWSLACVCSEMFLGLPLFPGVSQHNQLSRIVDMLGNPPSFLLDGKNGSKYFTVKPKTVSAPIDSLSNISRPNRDKPDINDNSKAQVTYRIKTAEEYAKETNTEVPKLRKYLRYDRLDEVIMKCPLANKDKLTQEQKNIEIMRRKCFLNFLQGLFNLNPFERWTAKQAASHPFITNAPFYGYFTTPEDLKAKERKIMFTAAMQRSQMAGGVNTSVKLNATNVQPFSDIPKTKADETATKEKEFVPLQQTGRRMTEPINTSKVVAEAAIEAATEAVLPALKRGEQVLPDYSSPVVQKTKRKPSGSGKSLAQSNEVPVPISSSMPLPMAMGPNNPSKPPDYYPTQHYVGNSYQNDPYRMSNSNIQYGSPGQATVWNGAYFVPVNQSTMMIQGQGIHPMTSPQGSFESLGGYINGIPQQVQHQSHSYGSQPMQQYYHLQGNSQFPYSGQPFYSQQQYLSQPPLDNSNYNQPYGYNQWGSLPGSESLSGSISAFGPVGSMQEGSSMSMTDFGYALARPDLNEYRKMNSQNVQHYSASHSLSNSLTYQIMKHGNSTRGSNAKSYDKNGLDHNYGRSEQRRTSFNQRNEGSRHRGREKSDKHVRHSMTEADRRNKSSHEGSYTASTNGSFSKSYEIGNYNNDEHFAGANRANVDSQASNLTDTTSPGSQIVMKMEEISMKDSEEDNTDSFVKDGARLRQRVSSGKLSEAGSANDDRNDGTEDAQADWDPFFPVDDIN